MNRKSLTTAVLAGLAGVAGVAATATAQTAPAPTMSLNPDGLGQVLIYPYYTTRNGNDTYLSVVNTTADTKAVKVRFLEGQNSREVLDFNLYLSPYDVWVAAIVDGGVVDTDCAVETETGNLIGATNGQCGVPHLIIPDTSCTVPYLFESASTLPGIQSFLNFKYVGDTDGDGGPTDIARAAEGHFEMIEMGVVDPGSGFAAAAKHQPQTSGPAKPQGCQALVDAWTRGPNPAISSDDGIWIQTNGLEDMLPPTGGLFGGASVINPSEGHMFSYDAKAIAGFVTTLTPRGQFLHAEPGSTNPSLNTSDVTTATVFLDDGSTLVSSGLTRAVDAVSFLFMHDQIANEYNTEALNQDGSNRVLNEWVITFPTKNFYVDADNPSITTTVPVAPFTTPWLKRNQDAFSTACEPAILGIIPDRAADRNDPLNDYVEPGIFDREEQFDREPVGPNRPPIVSPPPPDPTPPPFNTFELCYETNIVRFGAIPRNDAGEPVRGPTELFGSLNYTNVDNAALGFENGWVNMELLTYESPTGLQDRGGLGGLAGLPVTGFSAFRFGNLNVEEGIAAFYGGIYQHKGTRLESAVQP